MKQAQIQQLRQLVASEITTLHEHKSYLKQLVSAHWKLANPDTEDGVINFCYLNNVKDELRSITKIIEKLSTLIKELKKEERRTQGH